MATTFNVLDIIFFSITLTFVIIAFFRGFIKEIFSILNWIISFLISYYLTPLLIEPLSPYFSSKIALDIFLRTILFFICFLAIAFSTSGLSNTIKETFPKWLDKIMGITFAIGKSLLVFGLFYSLYFAIYKFLIGNNKSIDYQKDTPVFIREAKCYGIIKISGRVVDPVVNGVFNSVSKNFQKIISDQKLLENKVGEIVEEKFNDTIEQELIKKPLQEGKNFQEKDSQEKDSQEKDSGYKKNDIQKMERLIDIINK